MLPLIITFSELLIQVYDYRCMSNKSCIFLFAHDDWTKQKHVRLGLNSVVLKFKDKHNSYKI